MVHRIVWRVGSETALDFWAERLGVTRDDSTVRFEDPEGLGHELVVADAADAPLSAIMNSRRSAGYSGSRGR